MTLGGVAELIDKESTGTLSLDQRWKPLDHLTLEDLKTGEGTVNVSKVEGHADQAMVADGTFRHEDFIRNDGVDTAADFGRLTQRDGVISAWRALIRARRHWYPSCWTFTSLCLLSLVLRLNMMVMVVLPLMP